VSNVIERVVAHGLCCGCGICAGVAPCEMRMELTDEGVYEPTVPASCTDCGVCLVVCPFASRPSPPTQSPLGETLGCYVGHVADEAHRRQAASGGLTTALLAELLRSDEIDAVAAVRATGQHSPLFEVALLDTEEQVLGSASSRYYPVEFSGVLRQMRQRGGRFAVVALPCAARGLRLARKRFGWLAECLRFVIALTCGQNKSTRYTDHLAWMSGLRPAEVVEVDYRAEPAGRADDFVFVARDRSGGEGRPLPFVSSPVARVWSGRFYSLSSCMYCEDMFGEYADASVMDAWLPEFRADVRGTSIICVRQPALDEAMQRLREAGRVQIEPISRERAIESQRFNLRFKSVELAPRLEALRRQGVEVPTVRIRPRARPVSLMNRLQQFNQRLSARATPGSPVVSLALAVTRAVTRLHRLAMAVRRRLPGSKGDRQ